MCSARAVYMCVHSTCPCTRTCTLLVLYVAGNVDIEIEMEQVSSVKDLAVRFGCLEAQPLAEMLLERYVGPSSIMLVLRPHLC